MRAPFLTALGAVLLAILFWGLAPVANRYLLVSISPQHLLFLRFICASLLFTPVILWIRKQRWSRADILRAFLCGLANILGYNVAVTYGLQQLPAGTTAILVATSPLWIALLARIFLHEQLQWPVLVGLLLGIGGVAMLVGWTILQPEHNGAHFLTLEVGLVLFSSVMWAIYTIAVRPLSRKYGALVSTGLTTIFGSFPLILFWDSHLTSTFRTLSLPAYIAFTLLVLGSTIIATILWNYGVARLPGAQAGIFLNLPPFVSVIGGSFFLREHITSSVLLSGCIIILGVIVAQLPSIRAQRR